MSKSCIKCKVDKPLASFYKRSNNKLGLTNQCEDCAKAFWNKYYQANKNSLNERNKDYRKKNREKLKVTQAVRSRKHYLKNKEQCFASNKQSYFVKMSSHAMSDGSVTLKALKGMWTGKCYLCSKEIEWMNPTTNLDHKTPISRGGLHSIKNVAWSCRKCNYKKGSKTLEEFLKVKDLPPTLKFFREASPVAIKNYDCCGCKIQIKKGEKYIKQWAKESATKLINFKAHEGCRRALDQLNQIFYESRRSA